MTRKILFPIILGAFLTFLALTPARASDFMVSRQESSAQLKGNIVIIRPHNRVFILYHFLKEKESPLAPFAGDFIATADYYHVDWRLLPAISGLESDFGHLMIPHTYNAYGYLGGYYSFAGWKASIVFMNKYLADTYYKHGLITPETISRIYAPPCPYWGQAVRYFMYRLGNN